MFKSKSLWACIILLIAIILIAPFVDGFVLEKSVKRFAGHLNKQFPSLKLKITRYDRGWFSSKVNFLIDNDHQKASLKLNHGPLTFDHGFHFGLASIPSGKIPLWDYGHSTISGNINLNGDTKIQSLTHFSSKEISKIKNSLKGFIHVNTLKLRDLVATFHTTHDLRNSNVKLTLDDFYLDGRSGKSGKINVEFKKLQASANVQFNAFTQNYVLTPSLIASSFKAHDSRGTKINFDKIELSDIRIDKKAIAKGMSTMNPKMTIPERRNVMHSVIAGLVTAKTKLEIAKLVVKDDRLVNMRLSLKGTFPKLPKKHTYVDLIKNLELTVKYKMPMLNVPGFVQLKKLQMNENVQGFRKGNHSDFNLTVGQFNLIDPKIPKVTINQASLSGSLEMLTDKLSDQVLKLNIGDVTYNNQHDKLTVVKNINLDLLFDAYPVDLNVSNSMSMLKSIDSKAAFYEDFLKLYTQNLMKLITEKTTANLKDLSFTIVQTNLWPLKNQHYAFNAQLSWSKKPTKKDLLKDLVINAGLSLPKESVWYVNPSLKEKLKVKMLPYYFQELPGNYMSMPELRFSNVIPQFVHNGIFVLNNNHYKMQLKQQEGNLLSVNGHAASQIQSAYIYMNLGLTDRAAKILTDSKLASNPRAQNLLSTFYQYGWGVKQDTQKALSLRQKAVAAEDLTAMSALSYNYFRGVGVVPDFNKAISLSQVLVQKAPVQAANMCVYYLEGQAASHVEPNGPMALKWCQKAQGFGNYFANKALAALYTGQIKGVKVDLLKSTEYLMNMSAVTSIASPFYQMQLNKFIAKLSSAQLAQLSNDALTGNDIIQPDYRIAYVAAKLANKKDLSVKAKSKLTKDDLSKANKILNQLQPK